MLLTEKNVLITPLAQPRGRALTRLNDNYCMNMTVSHLSISFSNIKSYQSESRLKHESCLSAVQKKRTNKQVC